MHMSHPAAKLPHLNFLDEAAHDAHEDTVDPIGEDGLPHGKVAWWGAGGKSSSCEQPTASRKAQQLTRLKHHASEMRKRGKRVKRPAPALLQPVEVD